MTTRTCGTSSGWPRRLYVLEEIRPPGPPGRRAGVRPGNRRPGCRRGRGGEDSGRPWRPCLCLYEELGGVVATDIRLREMDRNDLRCPDPQAAFRMAERLEEARKDGDSLGGVVEIVVQGCPPGLGEPVFDKLDADLAKALMGIGTVKGVEIGAGFDAARMAGSQCNDALGPDGFRTNRAGGILAGISSGQDIVLRAACKPIPSIGKGQETVDVSGNPVQLAVRGRHDVCVIPRILPVCEAMVSIVLVDHLLRQRAIEG